MSNAGQLKLYLHSWLLEPKYACHWGLLEPAVNNSISAARSFGICFLFWLANYSVHLWSFYRAIYIAMHLHWCPNVWTVWCTIMVWSRQPSRIPQALQCRLFSDRPGQAWSHRLYPDTGIYVPGVPDPEVPVMVWTSSSAHNISFGDT